MGRRMIHWALCLVILLAAPCALLWFAFGLPPQYDLTYPAALADKLYRLHSAPGKRVILIGGSGAAFGVRSDLLEGELPGYAAVNLGLYASLGDEVLLDLAQPHLRPGDIVVFLPEQNKQTLSSYFGAQVLWQALDGQTIPWAALTPSQRGAMLGALPAFAGSKARLYFSGEKPLGEGVYARRSLNGYGDMACAGREGNAMPGGFDANQPISFDPSLLDDSLAARLNAFAAACRQTGASLYYGFGPMNASAISEAERDRADAFAASLHTRLACPVLGAPEEAMLDPGWFFDTNFHLNAAGQVFYTARLAGWLKTALGDPSPVSITVPPMPERAEAAVSAGDDRDADCFRYEAREGGVWIIGLTEAGAARTALTVPATRDGLPVVGFDAMVFAGNRVLRTLIIGENIALILDDSFSGCTALERIILHNPRPEAISVGDGLLRGTDAWVQVPAAAFSSFATNYFWSRHAARLVESAQ